LPLPSKSEIVSKSEEPVNRNQKVNENPRVKHNPVIEKPSRAFSIREVFSGTEEPAQKIAVNSETTANNNSVSQPEKVEFTGDNFSSGWQEFIDNLKGEGTRIVSMFKTIKPELTDEHTVLIHLSNAAQKDIFIQNYKQKLESFLLKRFLIPDLEVETVIDESETNELLYSDEQKFNYLQNKYPALKDFKKTFNLDIT
jgi:hypothetical protein